MLLILSMDSLFRGVSELVNGYMDGALAKGVANFINGFSVQKSS